MTPETQPGLKFLQPVWPAAEGLNAISSKRLGGVSFGEFSGLNLADHVGDDPVLVAENRANLQAQLSIPHIQWINQVHGTDIVQAQPDCTFVPTADACWTQQPGIACAVMTADCLPVLLFDKSTGIVAAVHAGWRGLSQGIISQTLSAINANPESTQIWLGPAISSNAYEVGAEVKTSFVDSTIFGGVTIESAFVETRVGHYLCDLYSLAKMELRHNGFNHIFGGDQCTYSQPEDYFSYRRDGRTGRIASLIWLDS